MQRLVHHAQRRRDAVRERDGRHAARGEPAGGRLAPALVAARGRERQQQLNETNNRKSGLSSDEEESSSSSGGEEELEPLPPRLSNRAGAE